MKATLGDVLNGWSIGLTAAVGGFLWFFAVGRRVGRMETELSEARCDISEIRKDVREIRSIIMNRPGG